MINKYFEDYEFKIFESNFDIDIKSGKVMYSYFIEKINLPTKRIILGPKVYMRDSLKKFISKRKDYFLREDRVCCYDERVLHDIKEIYDLSIEDLEKLINKDISFIYDIKKYLK
jgi:hypothetical protein